MTKDTTGVFDTALQTGVTELHNSSTLNHIQPALSLHLSPTEPHRRWAAFRSSLWRHCRLRNPASG